MDEGKRTAKLPVNNFESLLNKKLDEDEQFMEAFNYLDKNLQIGANTTEHSLRIALEDRELELNEQYLKQFENINSQVQSFVAKIKAMNMICQQMTERIHSNKEKTKELLKKTTILQNEKEELSSTHAYIDNFFAKYSLTQEEEHSLEIRNQVIIDDSFFKAFKRLLEINQNAVEKIAMEPENLVLLEISNLLSEKIERAYQVLYSSIQKECRLLNVEFLDLKPTLIYSFELIQLRVDLFEKVLEDYANARRGFVVHAFIETLTKGAAKSSSLHKQFDHFTSDSLKYVNEMLSWVQYIVQNEKEMLEILLRGCHCLAQDISRYTTNVLASISETLCQPLRLHIEQCITKEANCIVLYRLSNLLLYFIENYRGLLPGDSHLLICCRDVQELCSNMFYSTVSTAVQRLLANAHVPDYDLLPVNSVNRALLLLRDILESQNECNLTITVDKREIYNKIFMHILDPLMQSIQLVSSNLDNHLDVAVYMLNCLNAIRSLIILYQYTENKLEFINAQMEANEDVLVSEQASKILIETDMMELYTKSQAHQQNQGPLSDINGMESGRVQDSLTRFNQFLQTPDCNNCNQLAKVSSARIRNSIQRRTYEHVIAAYKIIWQKISDPINAYMPFEQLKSVEEVRSSLCNKNPL